MLIMVENLTFQDLVNRSKEIPVAAFYCEEIVAPRLFVICNNTWGGGVVIRLAIVYSHTGIHATYPVTQFKLTSHSSQSLGQLFVRCCPSASQ